jgi:hypothetical protein
MAMTGTPPCPPSFSDQGRPGVSPNLGREGSLDQNDNQPAFFWTYLMDALQTVAPGVGASALSLLLNKEIPVLDWCLPEGPRRRPVRWVTVPRPDSKEISGATSFGWLSAA